MPVKYIGYPRSELLFPEQLARRHKNNAAVVGAAPSKKPNSNATNKATTILPSHKKSKYTKVTSCVFFAAKVIPKITIKNNAMKKIVFLIKRIGLNQERGNSDDI